MIEQLKMSDTKGGAVQTQEVGKGAKLPLTREDLNESVDELKKEIRTFDSTLKNLLKPVWAFITVIIVTLFLGFLSTLLAMQAMILESNNFKSSAYQQLSDKVVDLEKELLKKLEPANATTTGQQ